MKFDCRPIAFSLSLIVTVNAAELSKEAQKAAKDIAPPAQHLQPPPQGKPSGIPLQNQGQQSPNYIPGNQLPQGQQPPPVQQLPDSSAIQDPARESIERSRTPGGGRFSRDTIGADQIDALRPARESLGLDQLNADDARNQPGFDPSEFGRRPGSKGNAETDALVEQLRGLTGGGNRERMSDQTRSYGDGIVTDPKAMLDGAGQGMAGDSVGTAQGNMGMIKTVDHEDGTRTVTEHHDRGDGFVQDITTEEGPGGVIYRQVEVTRAADGTVFTRTATRSADGTYWNTLETRNASGKTTESWRGPAPHVDVDPDSAYGKGGSPVDTDNRPDNIVHGSDAAEGVGPGARPDDNASAGVTPRLNVDVDLVGQPNPGEERAGGGVGYQDRGYNPNDFVRPPPPTP